MSTVDNVTVPDLPVVEDVAVQGVQVATVGLPGPQGPTGVVTAVAPITYDEPTRTVGIDPAGYAASVNGYAGTVVLSTSDIAEGTNLYYTDARASAAAPVQSVNGEVGTVLLSFDDLTDVSAPAPTTNDLVKFNGTNYTTTDAIVVDSVQFDTTAAESAVAAGLVYWDAEQGSLHLGLGPTESEFITLGQEVLYRVTNQSGAPLAKGKVVRFDGTVGNSGKLLADLFDASTDPAKYVMGIVAATIPNDADGYVVAFGKIRKVNTNVGGWVEGDILYADPAVPGGLTRVRPSAPNAIVTVAALVTKSATVGELFVRPTFAPSISETQDVLVSAVMDGQFLRWDSVQSVWKNVSVTTSGIPEGTNLYYTDVRAAAAAPVQSVNGLAGTVVLTTSNVAEGTALYYTNVRADARIAAADLGDLANVNESGASSGDLLTYDGSTWIAEAPVQYTVLSDYVSPYSYIGIAPFTSPTSSSVWTITRIPTSGSIVSMHAYSVEWDDRLTAVYT